ncbi:MAG: phosphate-starvation-inducible PsiE family protein [Crocosphaera sp.]|nr:phosphate-starvation-inducible PsiE family protein [Crocosphaera sp.]
MVKKETGKKSIKSLIMQFIHLFKDDNFMVVIHRVENIVSKVLAIALVIVIGFALFDLSLVLIKDLFTPEPVGFFHKTLLEVFGLFLNILIALELLENVTAYLRKHIVQVELVVVTALIAVARKIIIFDPIKFQKNDLIALAFACLALAGSYALIRYINQTSD